MTLFQKPISSSVEQFAEKFKRECIHESAIAPSLYNSCISLVSDTESLPGGEACYPIHEVLNWKLTRFGHQAREPLHAALLLNEDGSCWQAKLSIPRVDQQKGKTHKYETSVGAGSRAYLPAVPPDIRQQIGDRCGVSVPETGSFWEWLEQHPEIPIVWTEGGKKALCLLSLGYVAIALYGVNGGYRSKNADGDPVQPYLIADVATFCQPGRQHILAFDQDERVETRHKVNWALLRFGRLLEATEGSVAIASWDGKQGKGIDDLVVNEGSNAWEGAYRNAIQFSQWSAIHRLTTADYRSLLSSEVDPAELLWTLQQDWQGLELEKQKALIEDVITLAVANLSKHQTDTLIASLGLEPKEEQRQLYKTAESLIEQFRKSNSFETLAGLRGGYMWSVIAQNSSLYDYLQLIQTFGSRLRFNTLKKQVELDGEVFTVGTARTELSIRLGFQPKNKSDFLDIFLMAAKRNSYNPIVEYLDQVAVEYGDDTSILEGAANRYFGQADPIYNSMLTRTLVAAVARTYNPGCKVDTALILQGKQGLEKSTFFKVLAGGDEYFDDSLGNVSEKDEKLKLHRVWFAEWAELETVFKRKDVANTKAFLSSSVDYVRPPYGREVEAMPRSSVIVGSTNQDEFLSDSTGNRRFWVIPVLRQHLDIELLRAERDRIWAAAVSLYRRGEQWWLTQAEEAAAANIAERFQTSDPWEEVVNSHVQHLEFVTINEILNLALKIELGKQDKACQMRVANILKQAGWEKVARRIDGKPSKGWARPLPPDEESEQPPDEETQVRVLLEKISTCTNWSDFERLGQEFSHSVRESAWKQLSKTERRRINQLKAHHNTSATRRTGNGEESND